MGGLHAIGYTRVSTDEQKLNHRRDAFDDSSQRILEEKLSAVSCFWSVRERKLRFALPGDVVVAWKLDRLGRSLWDASKPGPEARLRKKQARLPKVHRPPR